MKFIDRYTYIFTQIAFGAIFVAILPYCTSFDLTGDNLIQDIAIYYAIGFFIDSIGSLVTEPFLRYTKFVTFIPYAEYVKAERSDPKLSLLAASLNHKRTMLTMFTLIPIMVVYEKLYNTAPYIASSSLGLFAIVFVLLQYKKSVSYIGSRVKQV